jgi:ATP-dependent helicase/nuclease subunit B
MAEFTRKILLTPDASASKRVRILLAKKALGFGVKVVTPHELLDEIRQAFLVPNAVDDWAEVIRQGMIKIPEAFWTKSFNVDPNGTSTAVADALDQLLRNGGLNGPWQSASLTDRTNSTLHELRELWDIVGNTLPPDLALINTARDRPDQSIYNFSIHRIGNWPRLDLQQIELIRMLNEKCGERDEELQSVLEQASSIPDIVHSSPTPHQLADLCFRGTSGQLGTSNELEFLIARDPLEEIECAVGAVQKFIERGSLPKDIGILIPDDNYYRRSMADVIALTGLNAAGQIEEFQLRDLGGEVVRSLLLIARGPVPKMALAALLASPIAPWRQSIGTRLSSYVMSGRFNLRPIKDMSEDEEKGLAAIRRLRDGQISLPEIIEIFAKNADQSSHSSRLRALAKLIAEHSPVSGELDYDQLLELVGHVDDTIEELTIFPQNGLRIFSENQDPWIEMRHLIVLGFNSGHYPSLPGTSPVFHDLEKQEINQQLGWDLPTAEAILQTRRTKFQRQISSASDSVMFFASARNIEGGPVQLSETATFIASLLGKEPEELFVPVHEGSDRLLVAKESYPISPRKAAISDLGLSRDLLVLRTDDDGNPLPESPSSLETLLVSPLAWLLGRINALPDPWSADTMDALLQGNIAHGIFENIFKTDGEIIDRENVEAAVDDALAEVIRQQAPLLSTAQWKVERNTLRGTLVQAVKSWRDVLEVLGAKVVGVEASLKGKFSGIPIRGFADEVVQLPGGKLVVVDFKKSSSGKRRERMELGYDCQVSLYEKMIQDNPDELGVEGSSETPGIVYYTLNDQRVLADDRTGFSQSVPGLIVVPNDVSTNALGEITEQINKLKRGVVEMNQEGDASSFAKEKALPDFALVSTPLVMMFAHRDKAEGDQ